MLAQAEVRRLTADYAVPARPHLSPRRMRRLQPFQGTTTFQAMR